MQDADSTDRWVATNMTTGWPDFHNRFLDLLSPADRRRVFALAAEAVQKLDDWAARYPLIRRARILPLALSVAAAAPFADVDAIVSTARLSLWVFTLDDVFDEELLPRGELPAQVELCRLVAWGKASAPDDQSLAAALGDVRAGLASYPLFGELGAEWARALSGTIDGMAREDFWRASYREAQPGTLPTYPEYLATGLYSIGGPPHVWAALITVGDPSTSRHLDHLHDMERQACICIRLANDLQSHAKEVTEGNVNSLVILGQILRARGWSPADSDTLARRWVSVDIEAGLAKLAALRRTPRTATGLPEAVIADIAAFVCEFYIQHDYHTFAASAPGADGWSPSESISLSMPRMPRMPHSRVPHSVDTGEQHDGSA